MAKKRAQKNAEARKAPTGFDKGFALTTTLPLAEAAYDVADDKPPILAPGYSLIGPIEIDIAKAKSLAKRTLGRAPDSHHSMTSSTNS